MTANNKNPNARPYKPSANLANEAEENKSIVNDICDEDIEFVTTFLTAAINDDVAKVSVLLHMLPQINLTIETVGFRDTDTNCVYSLLGCARFFRASKVCALLISLGLTKDYVDEDGNLY